MSICQSSSLTVVSQLEAQQAALELSDQALCEAVGFDREIVLTLIKKGTMRLPLSKVTAFAAALELDPVTDRHIGSIP